MYNLIRPAALLVLIAAAQPSAGLAETTSGGIISENPFGVSASSDAELADSVGAGIGTPLQRIRLQTDHQSLDSLQQNGQLARVEMDNWWAKSGAELIGANLVSQLSTR